MKIWLKNFYDYPIFFLFLNQAKGIVFNVLSFCFLSSYDLPFPLPRIISSSLLPLSQPLLRPFFYSLLFHFQLQFVGYASWHVINNPTFPFSLFSTIPLIFFYSPFELSHSIPFLSLSFNFIYFLSPFEFVSLE